MAKVVKRYPTESLESMLRRFKKKLDKDNTLKDIRKHDFYLGKSEKRKLKRKMAQQRREREANMALKREAARKERFSLERGERS